MFKKQTALLALSILALTACASTPKIATAPTTEAPTTSAVPCAALTPMSFSAVHDSQETIMEIRQFNAKLKAVCGP